MELFLVEKSDDMISVRIKDADMTLIAPMLEKLSESKDVTSARYVERHPDLDEPVLTVNVSAGKPEDAIVKAAGDMQDYFSVLNK